MPPRYTKDTVRSPGSSKYRCSYWQYDGGLFLSQMSQHLDASFQHHMKTFFDIDIGDSHLYAEQLDAYERSGRFYSLHSSQFGLTGPLEELDAASKALLEEAYSSQPKWASQGPFSPERPEPLRAGRIEVELHQKEAPKAVENFRCLCTGERGKLKSSGRVGHYKGCKFHRIVKGFICQSGDFVKGDGSGGDSIYGGRFQDDKAALKSKHCTIGVVGMANSGRNSNTSQFYITLAPDLNKLDGKHVVMGQVTGGMEILQRIDAEAASEDGTPRLEVIIADCGML